MKHHYKKLLLVFFFLLQFSFLKAQWVTIPDSNFVNWLDANGYAGCMNGNLMDTTCIAVVSATTVICINDSITDLTGIQYFDSLKILRCSNNYLTALPSLPNSLLELSCGFNQITVLPTLPNSLTTLKCEYNQLNTLPPLPNSLTYLYCIYSGLASLPTLPNSLTFLDCSSNNITNLPALPNSLIGLNCGWNLLDSLPTLPNSLQGLDARYLQLTSLPNLPNSITGLNLMANLLTNIPILPTSLVNFSCYQNALTNLPSLPTSLVTLDCRINQLISLPELPATLLTLYITYNYNLHCLPDLKNVINFDFGNTGLQCLPNYGHITNSIPPLSSLPLCDVFNNYGCDFFWNIRGKVYTDNNNNCIADINELALGNLKLNLFNGGGMLQQQAYSINNGLYTFNTDTGTYTYTVDTTDLPVLVTCPIAGFQTSVLTAIDSLDYDMDFGMQCKPGFDIGVTSVVRDSGRFRPANFAKVRIAAGDISNFYGLHCASGTSGSVKVVFSGPASFISASAGALVPVVLGDTLLYSIGDFGTVNFNSDFSILMQTDTTAVIGSPICFDVNVSPIAGDIYTVNNSLHYCFTVVGSIDPNTKEVFPGGNIDTAQHWLTYTINFQNTGSAPAEHIYILDTLDNSLDESTFALLSYNHQPLTQVMGKVIRFNFPNINLPDSTSDEPNSHGYVQYKVKLKTGLTNGTLIHNTANIIFDFNSPIATNTTENQILITTGVPLSFGEGSGVRFYPNPFHTSTILKINSPVKSGNYNLEIYNVMGEKIREIKSLNKNEIVIERNNLAGGIYIFKLFNEKELMGTGKLVVQ